MKEYYFMDDFGFRPLESEDFENGEVWENQVFESEILLSDHHGIYIPKIFAEDFPHDKDKWEITEEQKEILLDPEHEWYWETWQEIVDNCFFITEDGEKWELWQDGDLFAIRYVKDEEIHAIEENYI